MATFEEIPDELSPWQERLLDAEEIEKAAATLKRPTARMQLEALAKKIRKESEALKRVERSQQQASKEVEEVDTPSEKPLPKPTAASSTAQATAPKVPASVKYIPIDRFAFDAGGYNAPFVTLYIELKGVGSIPRENIECKFEKASFDMIVNDLDGKSYRLFKDHLEKDIDPQKSKIIVKADRIVVKLAKVKESDYGGYGYWSKLTDTKRSDMENGKKEDPQSSIMNLMKQMYDEGDDNMKKMIGETMMKQRSGELGRDKDMMASMDDF